MSTPFHLQSFLPFQVTSLADDLSLSLARQYRTEFEVSVPEWRVLAVLSQVGTATAGELGRMTQMDKPRVSRAITKMQKRGLLERELDEADQRVSILRLSADGQALYQQIVPLAQAWETRLLSGFSDSEISCVRSVLAKLKQRVEVVDQGE